MDLPGLEVPMVDAEYVTRVCRELVRINSVNPALVAGAPGEREIAEYVAGEMAALGLEVRRHQPVPGRVSVTGRWRGAGGGERGRERPRSLLLHAHSDTVGVEGMDHPFSGEVQDGRVYGRGAYDMKGSLAACLAAVGAIRQHGARLRGDLIVAAVADEEYGSLGTMDLVTHTRTDGAIVTEPTGLAVCLAHKGYCWLEVITEGRAAHGSRVEEGLDANLRMGWFLSELDRLERELRARPPHPLVGPPSLHAAVLQGGTGLSTYAARCMLQIERRTVPGETATQVTAEIQALLDAVARREPTFRGTVRLLLSREPFQVAPEARIVRAVAAAAEQVLGRGPQFIGDTPWMDAALLAAAGIETVVFGPAGGGAHSAVEWVDLQSLVRCAEVLARAAMAYCA